jgi:hypothetical protein
MIVGTIALVTAALFTGAAVYVSFVEHPARMSLPLPEALRQWKPAYARGAQMQVFLVVVSTICGLLAAMVTGDWRWVFGAFAIAAPAPYTILVMMPINNALKETPPAEADDVTLSRLEEWGRRHLIRTLLGALAVLIYCWAL